MLNKISAFLLSLSLVIVSSVAFAQADGGSIPQEATVTKEELLKPLKDDFVVGEENAPITIIEYASLTCPHCASFHNNTYGQIKDEYIDKGKVKFIFRSFPFDEPALRGAMIASCSGVDKFEKFIKAMFSTQSNWAPKKNYLEILSNIAKLGGMSGEEFDQCIADKDLEKSIMLSKFNAVKQLEVRSTPTFFVNGKMHKGARNYEYFSDVIEAELKKLNVENDVDSDAQVDVKAEEPAN